MNFIDFVSTPGSKFLFFFIGLVITSVLIAKWWGSQDGSTNYRMPEPDALDAIEIAVLKGGKKEVIRTVVFDLWHHNMIQLEGEGKNTKITSIPSKEEPKEVIHRAICQFTKTPRKASELFSDNKLNQHIKAYLVPVYGKLRKLHLAKEDAHISRQRLAFWGTFFIIFVTGGANLIFGIMRGDTLFMFFLIILFVISFSVWLVTLLPEKESPTRLGKEYLKSLRKHFNWLKDSVKSNEFPDGIDPAFYVAIFGASFLLDTEEYEIFINVFDIGGGCGDSSDGGCGDGCGGCGD